MSQPVTTPNPRRRSRMVFLCLSMCLVAFALPALGRARAEPLPCGILITIPKPPPVPFPSPKPAPVPPCGRHQRPCQRSSLGAEIVLYRCQGAAGVESGRVQTDAEGRFAFFGLDAAFDYYVEAAFPGHSLLELAYRRGAYAAPGMSDIAIAGQ